MQLLNLDERDVAFNFRKQLEAPDNESVQAVEGSVVDFGLMSRDAISMIVHMLLVQITM
jgi:hypothetical protein